MALERMDSAALLAAIQQAGESWTPGITSLSELSDQDKRLRLGAVPPRVELSLEAREQLATANRAATMAAAAGAPAAHDLRNVGGQNFITIPTRPVICTEAYAWDAGIPGQGQFEVTVDVKYEGECGPAGALL